ncbi:MAG: hypothetical protein BAA02_07245 [Paenibacillaceae bacterium ZCTH02-B3]|nr:MAG: hypothetical protein BAA02_07245 [Paenibacillaceae bacterium ZCTH02-B3]
MSADIGSILRSWFGDSMPQKDGVRVLELRIGQIVRGVLLQMLGEGEGIVSVGGVPVRARLEAEIPLGRGVMLQVQPGSNESTIILKPATAEAAGAMPEESLKEALRNFGLPDKPWAMELLRNLRRDGFPLDAETARAYAEMAAMKPPRTDVRQWMTAADAAFRRGLPGTPLSIASLREALFGAPIREQMQTLLNLLDSALKGAPRAGSSWTADAARLQRLLIEGQELLQAGGRWMSGESASGGAGAGSAAGGAGGSPAAAGHATGTAAGSSANAGAAVTAAPVLASSGASGTNAPAGGAAAGQAVSATPAAGGAMPSLRGIPVGPAQAVSSEKSAAGVQAGQRTDVPPPAGTRQEVSAAPADRQAAFSPAQAASVQAGTAAAQAGREGADWLARLLQWLGFGHERSLASGDALTAQPYGARAGSAGAETPMPADVPTRGAPNPWMMNEARGETLKSALLALASREDAPPALRETAQTLAQHITGQQLLLAGDRGSLGPYHYVTLFIPIVDRHGDTTAAVHVQTRKKRRGEWDADNVRLLFDLNMKHLGHTVADVQVVDRIVSMKVFNDDPWFRDLAERSRDALAAAFQDAGYQLSALRAVPFPGKTEDGESGNRQGRATDFPLFSLVNGDPASGGIVPSKPYKGVDLRI